MSDVGRPIDSVPLNGFVVGSDCPQIRFGDLLAMSNTHALTFNRPAAFLAGCYSPSDVLEYLGPNGELHQTTAQYKLAFVRPEHFLFAWTNIGPAALADRYLIEMDLPPQQSGGLALPESYAKPATIGRIIDAGWATECPANGLFRAVVYPRKGTIFERGDGLPPLLSVREHDIAHIEGPA